MKKIILALCICTIFAGAQVASIPAAKDAEVVRYSYLLAGNKAGFETASKQPDGSLLLHSEYNDRGRGPKIDEHVVLGKDGIPVELEKKGDFPEFHAACKRHQPASASYPGSGTQRRG